MPTPFTYPRFAFGSHQTRAFQMMNSQGYFLGKKPKNLHAEHLKSRLATLQRVTETILPSGCPFTIGGGLVRDALGGARPDDVDIWLPSNVTIEDCNAFQYWFQTQISGCECSIVFRGPGARGTMTLEESIAAVAYSDVNNHWVAECHIPGFPKVNFMRSMVPWTGDTQEFYNGLMRCFDLDICMMFIGFERGSKAESKYVIMPLHIVDACKRKARFANFTRTPSLNIIYWNALRMAHTAEQRTQGRIDKMNRKYQFNLTLDSIRLIETEDIIACPVKISQAVRWVDYIYAMPQPSYQEFADAS